MGLLSKRAGGDVLLSVPQERLLAACLPITCMFPIYVLLPEAQRELLHSTKPVLLLLQSGTFWTLRSFLGCMSQHLCPQRSCLCLSPVPLCVRVRLSLSFSICCSSASDDLFHPIWNSTSCSTVTVCAKHTFYMPSVLKERKPQDRLFRKLQIPPLSDVAENYLHSHTFAHKNIISCLSRACILCTPEMLQIHA